MQASRFSQIEAPLPGDRITPTPLFTVTGIDFAGPLKVRNQKSAETVHITLFTSSTMQAIHNEHVSDLSVY